MDDDKILEQLQKDHKLMAESLARLEGSILSELKILNDTVKNLTNQDDALHLRISTKNDKINQNERRITILETQSINNRWWIATTGVIVTAIAAMLAIFF